MTLLGHISNGAIILDQPIALPEGAAVKVEIVPPSASSAAETASQEEIPSLLERLGNFVGAFDSLPPDFSANVDHYLYGAPKRQ